MTSKIGRHQHDIQLNIAGYTPRPNIHPHLHSAPSPNQNRRIPYKKGGGSEKKSDGLELAASRTQFLFKKLAHCRGFDDTFQDGIPTLIAMGTDAREFEIRSEGQETTHVRDSSAQLLAG